MISWSADSGDWIGVSNLEWEAITEYFELFAIDLNQREVIVAIAVSPLKCDDQRSNYANKDNCYSISFHVFFIPNVTVQATAHDIGIAMKRASAIAGR